MTTIIDVAKKAGVSIKTVSRVMNGEAGVAAKTRYRVESAMTTLDYRPSQAARQLRSGKSHAIGMLYSDPSSGYQSRLNAAMMRASAESDRYLAISLFDEGENDWLVQLDSFLERTRVTSLVLVPPLCDSLALQALLQEKGVRFVLISPAHQQPGATAITMDDRQAAYEMTGHLIGLGHRRIGHITGDLDHISAVMRRQGYEQALARARPGIAEPSLVQDGAFNFRLALKAADRMLRLDSPPTAIFAANDDMAAAVYMAAGRRGLSIPDDLSVVGFDDTPIARTLWPALATVAQPFDRMAQKAVEILTHAGNGQGKADMPKIRENMSCLIPYKLHLRGSIAPLPVDLASD